MGQLRFVTLTGADDATDFERMRQLSQQFQVEWAVLYSPADTGNSPRFRSLEALEAFAQKANDAGMRIALHFCGASVKTLLCGAIQPALFPEAQRLFDLAEMFGRVQLNVCAKMSDEIGYKAVIQRMTRTENRTRVILQLNNTNQAMCKALAYENGFEVLLDRSGGRGREREDWSAQVWPSMDRGEPKRAGAAGGLGPHNLAHQLPMISKAAGDRSFWIDLESKLRDVEDRFNLDICEAVLRLAAELMLAQDREDGKLYGDGAQNVAELEGLWLDWWVGAALGRTVVMPPKNAASAVTLYRHTGEFLSFHPSEDLGEAVEILSEQLIALTPVHEGAWRARAIEGDNPEMEGPSLHIAGLRAVVAKVFGDRVACNPYNAKADGGYVY